MARLKDIALSTRDGFNIDPRIIEAEPGFNARDFRTPENQAHVLQLALSIKASGIKTPLTIRKTSDDRVILVDGESRLRAVMLLIEQGIDIVSVPCQAEGNHDDEATRVASMVIRNSGKQLTMLEQGDVYRRLLNYGWTEQMIGDQCGYTPQHIKDCLLLIAAPADIQKAVRAGMVASAAVVSTMRREKDKAESIIVAGVELAERCGKKVSGADLKRAGDSVAPRRHLGTKHTEKVIAFLEAIARGQILMPAVVAEQTLKDIGVWSKDQKPYP
jgi:ParB/RepB/Spo0J family partition protein